MVPERGETASVREGYQIFFYFYFFLKYLISLSHVVGSRGCKERY